MANLKFSCQTEQVKAVPTARSRRAADKNRSHAPSGNFRKHDLGIDVAREQRGALYAGLVLRLSDLDYDLPDRLIARVPVEPRDASRLMVVRARGEPAVEHRRFADLPAYLRPRDLLVFNTSSVLPARVRGARTDTAGKFEGLYLASMPGGAWNLMIKAGFRLRTGIELRLFNAEGDASDVLLRLESPAEQGWLARPISASGGRALDESAAELLGALGCTPLPPYILAARREEGLHVSDATDRAWYQTVYADVSRAGSVAAPTAGLHFTPALLTKLASSGVARADVVLHVGPGTFKPVETAFVEEHPMHAEWCHVPPDALRAVRSARRDGGRIIPVGTTSVRTLESLPAELPSGSAELGFARETRLLITPGFQFRWTDALITNFHLPRSTLMALVAARLPGGAAQLVELYRLAVEQGYRFYSYGDAMLILPDET